MTKKFPKQSLKLVLTSLVFQFISGGDIPYTNWGLTGTDLEPSTDTTLACSSMCLGTQCQQDSTWKATSCTAELKYICQVECKFKIRSNGYFTCLRHTTKKLRIVKKKRGKGARLKCCKYCNSEHRVYNFKLKHQYADINTTPYKDFLQGAEDANRAIK